MKKTIFILCAAAAMLVGACSKSGGGEQMQTDTDSVAYILGMNVGQQLLKMDSTLNVEAVCRGIRDVFEHTEQLSQADAKAFYLRYMNYLLPQKAVAYEEQFLDDIAKSNRSYAQTASGVTYTVDALGDQNVIPSSEMDTVVMRYLIRTQDGEEVYSSYTRKDTLRMAVGELRPGVQESLKLIGKGGKINAWMPSASVYGAAGDKELGVGPNATLYYEIELIDVDKYGSRRR